MNKLIAITAAAVATIAAYAADPGITIDYEASLHGSAASGGFAPYMIGSWKNGLMNGRNGAALDVAAFKRFDLSRRFSWEAGIELAADALTASDYERYRPADATWSVTRYRPSAFTLQQAYASVKYRQVYLTAGQKNPESYFVSSTVSSGDLARSNNSRGLPGVEAGFLDFVDIPFTNGWVQIDGSISYNKFTDNTFRHEQFNEYNDLVATGLLYTYKRCHFRTKPSQPFSVTAGMQVGGLFGGKTRWYDRGRLMLEEKHSAGLRDFFDMFLPTEGNGDAYYKGASLGTIDIKLRYRLHSGAEITAYMQNPWEDGSGIGKLNGWDGLWGMAWHSPKRGIITDAAVEWLDFTNESGPIPWEPGDYPGTTVRPGTSGGDNYYNNDMYGAYANYGMAIATPFLMAPVYNLDGTPYFAHNMARGIHAAVAGAIGDDVDWRLMYSYQQAWGMGRLPAAHCLINNSAMAEATWRADRLLDGLSLKAQAAFDTGSLRGNKFGAYLCVRYAGSLDLSKKKK